VITVVAFVVAAAVGTLARADVGRRWNAPGRVPWGTFAVNVAGSFLLGLLSDVAPATLTVLGVGGLGALTTFSSFARELVTAVERRRQLQAAGYLAATLLAGVAAAAAGIALAELA
jgi:fluoride exporter